jgi:Homeodomain-like domain
MPGPQPTPVTVTPLQRTTLEGVVRRASSPQVLVRRAQIVLAAAAGERNEAIARRLAGTPNWVRTWRARWAAAEERLAAVETAATPREVLGEIEAALADRPRPGAPPTFTPEQVVQIVALACEPPPAAACPTSHWTPRDLAAEAVRRGIVPTISPRTVERFLGSGPAQAPSEPVLADAQARRPDRLRRAGGDRVRPL